MGVRILTNDASNLAQFQVQRASAKLETSQRRLSSGDRIPSAQLDAAGLAISDRLGTQGIAIRQATRNAEDGLSYLEIRDGALHEIGGMLARLKELAMQAATGTVPKREKELLEDEAKALRLEIDRLAQATSRSAQPLMDGEGGDISVHVGPSSAPADLIDITTTPDINLERLGLSGLKLSDEESAREALTTLSSAIEKVAIVRGEIGAAESRLDHAIAGLAKSDVHVAAAHSVIRDTDVATEATEHAKLQLLANAGIAILAQANNVPQLALRLLA